MSGGGGICSTNSECNGYGICATATGTCVCDLYVDGEYCELPYAKEFGETKFLIWRIVYAVLFFLLVIFITYRGYLVWKERNGFNLRGIVHVFVWIVAFLRLLYFATDPFGQTRVVPYLFEQLIFGFAFFFLFTGFLFVLLFWAGAYHFNMKTKSGDLFFARMKIIFIIIDGIWFSIEFFYRIMNGLHEQNLIPQWHLFDTVYNAYIALICLVLTGGFAIYGSLLIKDLKKLQRTTVTIRLQKLTTSVVILSVTFFVCVLGLLVVILTNSIYFPLGAVATFSCDHFLEILLCMEMTYIMRANTEKPASNNTTSTLNSVNSANSASSLGSSASVSLTRSDSTPMWNSDGKLLENGGEY